MRAKENELRVRERDFENFQVEERMKVIKEIHKHFGRFFYQEREFQFLTFLKEIKIPHF